MLGWKQRTSDHAQVNTVGAEDDCLCSNRHGGGKGQVYVLERMWWRPMTSIHAQIDMVEVKDEQLCLDEHSGGHR